MSIDHWINSDTSKQARNRLLHSISQPIVCSSCFNQRSLCSKWHYHLAASTIQTAPGALQNTYLSTSKRSSEGAQLPIRNFFSLVSSGVLLLYWNHSFHKAAKKTIQLLSLNRLPNALHRCHDMVFRAYNIANRFCQNRSNRYRERWRCLKSVNIILCEGGAQYRIQKIRWRSS